MAPLTIVLLLATLAGAVDSASGVASFQKSSGGADLGPFLKRLEDNGLYTGTLRLLLSKISVKFRPPSASANAEWGYLSNTLYLPDTFKGPGGAVRYDLASNEVSTAVHELTHAAREFVADEKADPGTPAREHHDAVKTIWADVRSEAYFTRYSWWKADEVCGYFMGAAVSEVFEAVGDIVLYNTFKGGAKGAAAAGKGTELLLPTPENAGDDWEKALAARALQKFGRVSVKESAMFEGKLIGWEERPMTQDQMYSRVLGLSPPRDPKDLLKRLNEADNDWIRSVREKVAAARAKAGR
jgi:hypothetical protein